LDPSPRCYLTVHSRRLRAVSLREETPLTESLQPTDFQVHPRRHLISGWRLSPPEPDPFSLGPSRWVADLRPTIMNRSPFRRCRRGRPQMAARLVPRRPTGVESSTEVRCPVSQASPSAACSTAARLDASTPDASVSPWLRFRHPGALATAETRRAPATPNTGPLKAKAPYHRQVPACLGRAYALPLLAWAATIPRLCHQREGFRRAFAVPPGNR
jgi:hypothetical protein